MLIRLLDELYECKNEITLTDFHKKAIDDTCFNLLHKIIANQRILNKLTDEDFLKYIKILQALYVKYPTLTQLLSASDIFNIIIQTNYIEKEYCCCYEHYELFNEKGDFDLNNCIKIDRLNALFILFYSVVKINIFNESEFDVVIQYLTTDISPCIIRKTLYVLNCLLTDSDINYRNMFISLMTSKSNYFYTFLLFLILFFIIS